MTPSATQPEADEFEISIFGPGVGECIVVHLGCGEWIVVDSHLDIGGPVALDYLLRLGVNPSTAIRALIVTHWHDDHIRGASDVLRAAGGADFFCSAALRKMEFFEYVGCAEGFASASGKITSGMDEFARIMEILWERAPRDARPEAISPRWVLANQLVCSRPERDGIPAVDVVAVSPSAGALGLAFHEIADALPALGARKRRIVAQNPNESPWHFGFASGRNPHS